MSSRTMRQQAQGAVAGSAPCLGAEPQMLAIARACHCEPNAILCDELSLGLASILLDEIFDSIRQLAGRGFRS